MDHLELGGFMKPAHSLIDRSSEQRGFSPQNKGEHRTSCHTCKRKFKNSHEKHRQGYKCDGKEGSLWGKNRRQRGVRQGSNDTRGSRPWRPRGKDTTLRRKVGKLVPILAVIKRQYAKATHGPNHDLFGPDRVFILLSYEMWCSVVKWPTIKAQDRGGCQQLPDHDKRSQY